MGKDDIYLLSWFTGKKTPSNKTLALTKTMNMGIWVAGTSNQLSLFDALKLKQNFQINKVVTSKTSFFETGPFYTHHSVCLKIDF